MVKYQSPHLLSFINRSLTRSFGTLEMVGKKTMKLWRSLDIQASSLESVKQSEHLEKLLFDPSRISHWRIVRVCLRSSLLENPWLKIESLWKTLGSKSSLLETFVPNSQTNPKEVVVRSNWKKLVKDRSCSLNIKFQRPL